MFHGLHYGGNRLLICQNNAFMNPLYHDCQSCEHKGNCDLNKPVILPETPESELFKKMSKK